MGMRWICKGSAMALAIAVMCGASIGAPVRAESILFMSGPAGGTWFPLAGAFKQLLEEEIEGLSVTVRPGAGLINIKGIAAGKAHIAWGNVISTVDAVDGRPPFGDPVADLCNVAALYQQVMQIPVTDLAISTVGELRGKALATLPRGNTTEVAAQSVLSIFGLSYDDLGKINFASITDQVNMMKDGQIDSMVLVSSVPAGGLMDLSTSRKMRLLEIPDAELGKLRELNAGWTRITIPSGTYRGQETEIQTVAYPMHLMASCSNVSEQLGYDITRVIVERGGELAAVTSTMSGYGLDMASTDVGLAYHPGARRYFVEHGAIVE